MLLSCKDHVVDSLKQLIAPHVIHLNEYSQKTCWFCREKAEYKLSE